ncbi:protein FAR-RED IMPAIRED RESPONSE 1-like [Chenopodium quinoa]|uniref:protein FAR-RED IMPAIRED RESPONSE 1-like n=1 Tax=Chenopodium quinoa TaxID=63459 RepID=UPI000B778E35|nr:protein FAR-RED IMPAIRED RESPONSE 1-like [Chenopodium quinoa]
MSEGVGCLLGGKGEDEIFEEDEVMLIGDDKMGDDEGNMVVDYVKGSGESGGYCTPDEKECKSMVNMDCVSVNPPEVGMIFDTWQEADMYYNAYDTRKKIGGKRVAKELEREPVATKKSKKCGCLAKVYAWLLDNGKWELKKVELEHRNHNPTPSKALLVPKYRLTELERMPYVRKKLKFADDVGINTSTMHNLMASERNGLENMRFTRKDLHNLRAREKKLKFKDGDANAMMNYFQMMQKNNKNFYHMQRLHKNSVLQDVLWVDARSRAAYEDFGDVTTLLGCALISQENAETFKWVFSTWIDVVGRIPPMAILTDQNAAMRKAFKNVISQTRHRWCLWHITEKFGSKLGKCKGYAEFKEELKNIIYDSLKREMWIPAAMKHMFSAGMKTTQRSEGIHNFFDEIFDKHTSLCDFAERYVRAMEHYIDAESDIDKNEKPVNRWKMYRVLYNAKTEEVECECMLFEYNEILCRHCINALEVQQIPDVPKKYILDRWQKDVYRKHSRVKVSYHDLSKITEVLRYDKMMLAFEPISCLDSENDDALSMVIAGLQELEVNIKKIVKPTLPLSSVGEAKTKSTPQSVNKALVSTQFHIPSSVARSVIDGGLVEMNKRL